METNQNYLLNLERELKYRNYSLRTIKAYCSCVKCFLIYIQYEVEKINKEKIIDFIIVLQNEKKAPKTINLYKEAIKFFLHEVIRIQVDINIKLSHESKKLPVILTKNEIRLIIENIKNEKHKFIISLSYSS